MVVGDSTDPMWRSYVAVHTALAIPPHDRMEWTAKGQFVKASPSQRNFSDVAINPAGKGANWYGRCLVLFHYDKDGATKQAAYIEYYTEDKQDPDVRLLNRFVW
ncbi:hypothetical protein CLOM_g4941 [Closterium sp. NIES-68]|nr:hypothetical protein CLOM_g4941 [Closterium sp. NIES-68]